MTSMKVNQLILGFCFEIKFTVENSIQKMNLRYDIHLNVSRPILGSDIKIKFGVGSPEPENWASL